MTNTEEFLAHYGVLGMHWGRRSGSSNVSTPKQSNHSQEHANLRATAKKHAKTLSDAELKSAISRMQLERQYKDLNPKGLSKANKTVLAVLAIGTTVNSVVAFANSPAGKTVISSIKKSLVKVP
jgi:hypothetical protein